MKLIPLNTSQLKKDKNKNKEKRFFAKVDDSDYDYLMQWKWCSAYQDGWYVVSHEKKTHRSIRMHCLIMKPIKNKIIDHLDGDGLNNQRGNLRMVTHAQNSWNRRVTLGASKYKGVSLTTYKYKRTTYRYWLTRITVNKKRIRAGHYPFTKEGEILAGKAYNKVAKKYYGKFAVLNKI